MIAQPVEAQPLLPGVDWFVDSKDPTVSTSRFPRRAPDYAIAADGSIAIRAARAAMSGGPDAPARRQMSDEPVPGVM